MNMFQDNKDLTAQDTDWYASLHYSARDKSSYQLATLARKRRFSDFHGNLPTKETPSLKEFTLRFSTLINDVAAFLNRTC